MLYLTFLALFVVICAGLLMHRPWEKASAWATAVGVACVVAGVLMEVLRFQQSKNQKQLFTLPGRDRDGTTQAGLLLFIPLLRARERYVRRVCGLGFFPHRRHASDNPTTVHWHIFGSCTSTVLSDTTEITVGLAVGTGARYQRIRDVHLLATPIEGVGLTASSDGIRVNETGLAQTLNGGTGRV